jgi:hypothetical protein
MWHCDSDATSISSGFQRSVAPRNAGSALPAMVGLPSIVTSCARSNAWYPLVPVPVLPVQVTVSA